MTPQDQEFFSCPEKGQYGDCQRAVIATLLDLPISSVPHFLQEANNEAEAFWEGIQTFCAAHGFAYLEIPAITGLGFWGLDDLPYHVISGPSPRGNGLYHSVVGRGRTVVFDPHPSRAGLLGTADAWSYGFLVKL